MHVRAICFRSAVPDVIKHAHSPETRTEGLPRSRMHERQSGHQMQHDANGQTTLATTHRQQFTRCIGRGGIVFAVGLVQASASLVA